MKEDPYFEGIILDPAIYLELAQTRKDYFKAKGYSIERFSW